MRAARIHAWGAAPVVDEVPEPVREEGRVLVEVQAGAVAHLDASVAGGDFRLKPELPYIGGVEGAGVVLEADPDSGLTPGTQVVLRGGGLGLLRDGIWTERTSVSPKACMPLETALPPETAASFFVPATTAYVVLHDVARLREGERVVVVGAAGAVGSMVAQQARAAGAEVVGVVGRKEQLADVPDGIEALVLDEAEHLAEQRSADLLVDTLGGVGLIGRSRWVRQGGRAAVIGYVTGTAVEIDLPSWLLDDVALLPVNMIRQERRAREVCGDLVHRLTDGTLNVPVETFALEDTAKALDALRAGRVRGRAVVLPK
ncbi:quinone oxidoreductase family protein [Streptomyces ochraceiscleroticus]|uniref:Zinc-binding alcohol dehydrogenase family protein n=1 Tax=Streptomyces ochraceiscleroticus TaxID=47761 RepID=A0ABW1MH91_9ACTN|nr:zinc-binding dehydrogenase [Streptomyces ochraceiscleroticus]